MKRSEMKLKRIRQTEERRKSLYEHNYMLHINGSRNKIISSKSCRAIKPDDYKHP